MCGRTFASKDNKADALEGHWLLGVLSRTGSISAMSRQMNWTFAQAALKSGDCKNFFNNLINQNG